MCLWKMIKKTDLEVKLATLWVGFLVGKGQYNYLKKGKKSVPWWSHCTGHHNHTKENMDPVIPDN